MKKQQLSTTPDFLRKNLVVVVEKPSLKSNSS